MYIFLLEYFESRVEKRRYMRVVTRFSKDIHKGNGKRYAKISKHLLIMIYNTLFHNKDIHHFIKHRIWENLILVIE